MRPSERGFALVAVLAALAVAAMLAVAALALARGAVAGSSGYAAELEGGHAAAAAIMATAVRLADGEAYDLANAAPAEFAWGGWRVAVRIEDEATKLDLNRAPRDRIAAGLAAAGVPPSAAAALRRLPAGRFVAVDELAARLGLDSDGLGMLQRNFTVSGGEAPQPPAARSPLETYRIVAEAARGSRRIVRWRIVRISAGFGEPFEWLGGGAERDVTPPSRPFHQR